MLHVEMCFQEMFGKLVGGSGWETLFHDAKIYESGVCTSLLGGKFIKRTRYAYELTLVWLDLMGKRAYKHYLEQSGPHEPFQVWEDRLAATCPTIKFWVLVRDYLLVYMVFIRGQRSGNWNDTLIALKYMCPWFFVFGHINYGRWVPVSLRDMCLLPDTHPEIHDAFVKGLFVVQRSNSKFSTMALDQSQEHSIRYLKEYGGSLGLYNDKKEKEVSEISRPELLRVIEEFESHLSGLTGNTCEHKDVSQAAQTRLKRDVEALTILCRERSDYQSLPRTKFRFNNS